ncbi:DUF2975 domain-containing protein [Hymenobacter sp. 15J16-1T3B]|uniref:DUF2975 domain-containing protein n=1 Tax=Hymenobacter sp. 15J16-1T3B TaxID=2886941 RepID=UPI001D112427|nr:DUF2975 domain-containing protein [Hymenobacter sp. 15J16-1T3B]MCC3160646.1 DUF2975 domain-containing protein [Hymenobacter sp. 15J16-1T3B]
MTAPVPEPPLFRVLRWLALLQYVGAGVGLAINLLLGLWSLGDARNDLAFVTLQATARARGQLHTTETASDPARPPYHLVEKSSQHRLIYHEPNAAKRVALALLGVKNSSLGRASLGILLFTMLTGRLLYHMLRDMRLDTPFTEANARRIRWLGLLALGIDAYEFLALKALQALVLAFSLGDERLGTVTRYIVLDPSMGGWGSWKFGLLLLVLATIYQRGVELAREAELTI